MSAFSTRLQRVAKLGKLTPSDLATIMGRNNATVRTWLYDGRTPSGPQAERAHSLLTQLELSVKRDKRFPVPPLSPIPRKAYVRKLARDLSPRVSRKRAA